ncbi:MAG: DUF5106 domain-containing protein [Bacteroidales bacterium]|nr:DUF5106 domain-containing protein [Bacteroidales bacterium]
MLNRIKVFVLILLSLTLASSCGGGRSNSKVKDEVHAKVASGVNAKVAEHSKVQAKSLPADVNTGKMRNFSIPQVPSLFSGQKETAEYLSVHFWDNFFSTEKYHTDSLTYNGIAREELQGAMINYVSILYIIPLSEAQKSLAALTDKALAYPQPEASKGFLKILEYYLYDANSVYRNEDFFLPVTSRLATWQELTEVEREKYARYAKFCAFNQIGTVAADFTYCDKQGRKGTLHTLSAENLLIFFSNPGCSACKQIIEKISASEKISSLISGRKLKILNLYIDEDLAAWHEYMPIYPKTWINAYQDDFSVRNDTKYNIRALPSLYILDSEKRVVMRDVPEDVAINYLENL